MVGGSLLFLALGAVLMTQLKQQFFPEDVQYWAYVDVWLPNDAPLSTTNETARRVEEVAREVIRHHGREHPGRDGKPREMLRSLTTFVGGGGPRFWFSVSPELQQLNYAKIIIEVTDKEATPELVGPIQTMLSATVPGARVDVRQLQTNPVEMPIDIRVSGRADVSALQEAADIWTLRQLAAGVQEIFRAIPQAARVRTNWGEESATLKLRIDPDRANLAGVTNLDVAYSSTAAMSGAQVTTLREGDQQIPVVAQLRMEERARLADVQNLYVYASIGSQKVPLMAISTVEHAIETQRIRRLEHFRTISFQGFAAPGFLTSEALNAALPKLQELKRALPPGYRLDIGGERAK